MPDNHDIATVNRKGLLPKLSGAATDFLDGSGAFSVPGGTSGTYTPTLTNVSNLDASTAFLCQYLRVGSVVTVSGQVNMDATIPATLTELRMSLPIASNLGAATNLGGTAFANNVAGLGAAIYADSANDAALFSYASSDTNDRAFFFSFTYRII